MKRLDAVKKVFWALVALFLIIVLYFVIPVAEMSKNMFFPYISAIVITFFLLGITLVILSWKLKGTLKKALILTGASASMFLIGVIAHNMFYALNIVSENIKVISYAATALSVTFFLIAVIGCPLAFLTGMIASIILLRKKYK